MKVDGEEFERMITEYAPVMYRAALAVTGSEAAAEDAVGELEPEKRAVVTLYYYEGFSTGEIARMLGVRQGTVKSRLWRAREELRRILEG